MRWLLAILAIAMLPTPLSASSIEQAGDWLLVCDNHDDCTIIGAPLPSVLPGYPRTQVTIWRRNRGGSPLLIAFRLVDESGAPDPPGGTVNGLGLGHTMTDGIMATLRVDPSINSEHGDVLMPERGGAVIGVIADEAPSHLLSGFGAYAAMPQGDLAALLQRMEREQPRAADLPSPVIEDLPQVAAWLLELFPREQTDQPVTHPVFNRACARAPYSFARGFALDHTSEPTLLVLLSCGGRDFVYTWYPSGGGPPVPLILPRERERRHRQTSAGFDQDRGILVLTDHPARRSDCGRRHSYGWIDDRGWILLMTQVMPRCGGIASASWPVLFRQDGWEPS